jgi:hypothetical protein
MAGAHEVYAITKDSRFGSAEEATAQTHDIARKGGLQGRIQVIRCATHDVLAKADIVTNSGHLRPINAEQIAFMKPTTVVPLMYENWEFRPSDIDLDACRKQGVRVAGTNERHPAIGVFEFLGAMAIKLLLEGGLPVLGSRILLICDNAFRSFLEAGLRAAGANLITGLAEANGMRRLDAVLVATTPTATPALTPKEVTRIANESPGAGVFQFFGTLDRAVLQENGVPIWPEHEPQAGHMGILPSAIGPEPVVRLQAGGLKVGEVLYRKRFSNGDPSIDFAQALLA